MVFAGQQVLAVQQTGSSHWSNESGVASCGSLACDPPPPAWPDADPPGISHLLLSRAVERDVVPHLGLGRRGGMDQPNSARAGAPTAVPSAAVEEFVALMLGREPALAAAYAAQARGRRGIEALCLDLLAPAARHLGDLWTEDAVDFAQVAIGLGLLHRLLREFSSVPENTRVASPAKERRALLVAGPGEQHTFGLAIVTALFRRAGWTVWSGAPAGAGELAAMVGKNWFAVVGFSLGHEARLDALRSSIAAVRRASRNPQLGIMVGGPAFTGKSHLAVQVGADAMAVDGRQAVLQAHRLMRLRAPVCAQ